MYCWIPSFQGKLNLHWISYLPPEHWLKIYACPAYNSTCPGHQDKWFLYPCRHIYSHINRCWYLWKWRRSGSNVGTQETRLRPGKWRSLKTNDTQYSQANTDPWRQTTCKVVRQILKERKLSRIFHWTWTPKSIKLKYYSHNSFICRHEQPNSQTSRFAE